MTAPLTRPQIAARVCVTLLGTFVMALGIALAKHAAVGTTPISCLPAVLYNFFAGLGLPVTLGLFTFLMNTGFLVGEMVVLRGAFPKAQLLQLPQVVLFSMAVDFWMGLVVPALPMTAPVHHYTLLVASMLVIALGLLQLPQVVLFSMAVDFWMGLVVPALPMTAPVHHYTLLVASMLVIALGIQLQLMGDTIVTPPEGFIGIVARRTGHEYGDVKVAFDVGFLVSAAALSLALMGGLTDVREGTIVAAVGVGVAIKGWGRVLRPLARRLPQGPTPLPPLP